MNRWINAAIVVLLVLTVAGLVIKARTPRPGVQAAAEPGYTATQAVPSVEESGRAEVTPSGAVVVFEGEQEEGEDEPLEDPALAEPLSSKPPSELALTDVKNYTTKNGLTVLVLQDGSELIVNDYVYKQLPESIRFRLEYRRGER
ncbi:MAG TPA: hypothetical protein ENK37_11425 [Oceanithermus profundus]|uniref:Uncharacterized protein n=1 Tax=Oceanithermus profundus TaxID=187137 RepID=A0A7C4ZSI2_9DEIN|nr:hypothetical protein [Oceanithermus profundus]